MNSFLLALLLVTPAQQNYSAKSLTAENTILYEEIFDQAIRNCPNARPEKVDPGLLWELIEVEKKFKVPNKLKGMVLAAACRESGYNPLAEGDHKFSRSKKRPMAIGILQMWKFYERVYPGLDRKIPKSAAEGWMKHIVSKIPKVKRICKYKTKEKVWIAAWVTGIRAPKAGGRCAEKPLHLKILKTWHRNIKRERLEERERHYMPFDRTIKEGDGC